MKLSFNDKITQADFPKAGEAFSPRFVKNFADMVRQVSQWSQKGVTLADNCNGAVLTLNMAHGVPQLVSKPLPGGANPLGVRAINCDTQAIPTLTMSQTATVNGVVVNAGQGSVWLTALYPIAPKSLSIVTQFANKISIGTSTSVVNVCSPAAIVLTPGQWALQAFVGASFTGAINQFDAGVSASSASLPGNAIVVPDALGNCRMIESLVAGTLADFQILSTSMAYPVSVATGATSTLFLVSSGTFSSGSGTTWGTLLAQLTGPAAGTTANVTLFIEGA